MRYLPKNSKDTYNYQNPNIMDKVKRFFQNINDDKIGFFIKFILPLFAIGLVIAIFMIILPLLIGYYTLMVFAVIALIGGRL